jgi:transcription-repair coupling factor (superfamily II helicase)
MSIESLVLAKPRFNALCDRLRALPADGGNVVQLRGLTGSAPATFLAPIKGALPRVYLCVLNDEESAGYFYHDLCQVGGDEGVLFFPSAYKRSIKYGQVDSANEILRTEVMGAIEVRSRDAGGLMVVTYPEALAEKVATRGSLQQRLLYISRGEALSLQAVVGTLHDYGFRRVDYVYEPGQYAVRGSLIDVYSYSSEYPYRVDFFGDEVDSLRTFEVDSQLSRDRVDSVTIMPDLGEESTHGTSLAEVLPEGSIVICADAQWVVEQVRAVSSQNLSAQLIESEEGDLQALQKLIDPEPFAARFSQFNRVELSNREDIIPGATVIEFHTTPQPLWHKNFDLISADLRRYVQQGYTLHILSDSEHQIERIRAILADRGDGDLTLHPVLKPIHAGFADDDTRQCYFTDHQIFDRYHKYNLKSDRARSGKIALSLKELQEFMIGDYIVHVDHGIGKFGGLVRLPVTGAAGKTQEVVKLIYKNDDILFVSIHALDKLSKYRGKDATPPVLSKLGSGAWERLRDKTKSKMKDMARELILLYAKRREEKGYAFSPDTHMQQELEASFIYEDTPDQLKATIDVKHDMESDRPMDRLICGDVGFGKTEVAIRAALKACADCKQVAVLVPTTVLAFQHYKTFSDRLKEFPVRVDYLTRARSAKDTRQLLHDIADGSVNIIIGTHKLIGKEVKFNDLGLLVIDEEQKFGVKTKEALKRLRVNVDTLTMSATPIPRTLQFSLMGARDMSIIATPPANRYPIRTEVHHDDDDILREAINFELSRGGQVFVINNRISQLPDIVARIERLVPDARVAAGHGQMESDLLEKLIMDFSNHEFDVLVCTTIIEAGLDIPNANTIIICHAQNYGLSELHQLRGRVGRTNKKAFCYLLAPALSTLTPDARRRLQAIENFAGLGSGIHLAMQDLDIRGAGNLLGGEQSGFIADLGYETYQKILREAVGELKSQEFAELFEEDAAEHPMEDFTDVEIPTGQRLEDAAEKIADAGKKLAAKAESSDRDAQAAAKAAHREGRQQALSGQIFVQDCNLDSDLELFFAESYIPDSSERIALYQELDRITRPQEIDAYCARLVDRFGPIPPEGEELIRVVALRRMGQQLGFERLSLKQGKMTAYFCSTSPFYFQSETFGRVLNYITSHIKTCQLRDQNGRRSVVFNQVRSVKAACAIFSEMIKG